MKTARRGLIIGYDPGITSAISILDTHGNLISLISKRNIGKDNTIKLISEFGRPLLISTDKNPLPRSVKKLASKFGAKPYYPETSLSNIEKGELVKEIEVKTNNRHELDALAASIKAWKRYRELFIRIDNTLRELGLSHLFDIVVEKLMSKKSYSIHDAINQALIEQHKIT